MLKTCILDQKARFLTLFTDISMKSRDTRSPPGSGLPPSHAKDLFSRTQGRPASSTC